MNQEKRYTFSNTLMSLVREQAPAFAMAVRDSLEAYLSQWKKAPPETNTKQSGMRARQLHILTDQLISEGTELQKPPISCRQGCAHCCKMNVGITSAEADQLANWLQFSGRTISTGTLQRQALYEGDQQWAAQPEADRTCVFLNPNQTCSVYQLRPMACRKHFVLSPPEDCDIEKNREGHTLGWFDIDAEILATAAMTHWPTGSLPEMLLGALERQGKESDRP